MNRDGRARSPGETGSMPASGPAKGVRVQSTVFPLRLLIRPPSCPSGRTRSRQQTSASRSACAAMFAQPSPASDESGLVKLKRARVERFDPRGIARTPRPI